jgi:FkbM family methyltransferase
MKILYIAPHLSTGGSPQYLLKKIQILVKEHEVYCVEYSNHGGFTVQRNQIKEILKDRFFELGENKMKVMDIINKINPEVVHLEEMPEYFMDGNLAVELYSKNRKYKLIETSHDSSFNPQSKTMFPDKILFVSKYQMETLKSLDVPMDVCEYPIVINPRKPREEALKVLGLDPNKKHVVNVGLFTPRKNQAEIIEYAKQLRNYPIQFHFIGNQADNFKFYWEPLRKDFPPNCTWWDERKDVHNFYQAADLFLFTSRGTNNDKETSPLVIREAISYNIPSLIYNLPVYLGMYDKYENIQYLDFDSKENNINKILKTLKIDYMEKKFYTMKGEEDLSSYKYPNTAMEILQKYGDGACMYWNNFVYKELERFDVTVDAGDVFVDLGANIGMSARYAHDKGAREIYCFEPDPNMVEILKKNVPSAKIYQNAIDKDIKEIELYHWPHNPVNIGPKYKTSTVRIKDVINMIGKPIDYLKVDIEGFEDSAFDELSQSDLSMVKKFFIEHHIPEKVNQFCEKLKSKGLDVKIEYGMGQNFIYATLSKLNKTKYNFTVNWDSGEQKVTYSCDKDINLPISITLREYKSNAVLWSAEYDHIPANCNYWMIPIPKSICDYSTSEFISGIKFCVYNRNTDEQIYEYPFFHKFVNIPTVTLSNKAPYFINYLEYFVENKYDCWFKTGKKFNTAIDVGANIGIFTEFLIQNKLAKKILAVECDDQALYDLKKNYELNDNVKIIQKALSYNNEPITFYKCKENSIISTTIPPEKIVHHGAGSINKIKTVVDTITIEEIVKEFDHIDLLKIDVEGAEYSIFEKLNSNISKNIDHMFIECHFFESDCIEKYEMLKQKVISMGYEIDDKLITRANSKIGSSESIFCTRK